MAISPAGQVQAQELLDAVRGGDQVAFGRIVEEHRGALLAHCYRMLGSLHDAEDALQDTLLRAWRGLPKFEARSSLRSWLYTIATNACLDVIARRPKRVLPIDYGPPSTADTKIGTPLVETVWLEPYPEAELGVDDGYAAPEARYEQRESVELAFIAALQHLPATQRAVLIMREVLGFSAREVSESLDTTVAAVNSSLQRARKSVADKLPERSQQSTLRSLGDERIRELVDAYVDAFERGDFETVRMLLAEDAVFSMPPWSNWWRGRDTIASFALHASPDCPVTREIRTSANGQPAIAHYGLDEETGRYLPAAIDVFTFEGPLIKEVTAFVLPQLFPRFGLPPELERAEPGRGQAEA
jgi:RNA polymerase sigma-70 factor (ECF subfamily)